MGGVENFQPYVYIRPTSNICKISLKEYTCHTNDILHNYANTCIIIHKIRDILHIEGNFSKKQPIIVETVGRKGIF